MNDDTAFDQTNRMMSPRLTLAAIGTAGWALPAADRELVGERAFLLSRYATRFNCVEFTVGTALPPSNAGPIYYV